MKTRLREIRQRKHISQRKLADDLYISIRTISRYENGHFSPRFAIICDIAKYLGVSLDELCCGDSEEDEPP